VRNNIARFQIWGENARNAVLRIMSQLSGIDKIFKDNKFVITLDKKKNRGSFELLLNTLLSAPTSAT